VERVLQGPPAQGAAHAASLEEPAWDDDSHLGGGRAFRAAFGRVEPEFDVVEHRQALAPPIAALPERERRILLLRVASGT
jgi:RNA polymerase sigma-B factor